MPTIKPFRQYAEADVINGLFTVSGADVSKGTFVVAQGSGYNADAEMTFENTSPFDGTYASKFNVPANVVPAPSGTAPHQIVGMTLVDHKTFDENGDRLIYHRRKAAEMEVTISGQGAPLLTKGIVLYSGINGDPALGSGAAIADAGDGSVKVVHPTILVSGQNLPNPAAFGKFLGRKDQNGFALLQFSV